MAPKPKPKPETLAQQIAAANSADTASGAGATLGTTAGGTAGNANSADAYSLFQGISVENQAAKVTPGDGAGMSNAFSTVEQGAAWLAKASPQEVESIQFWLIEAGLLSTTKGLTVGQVGSTTQHAFDYALVRSAASNGAVTVSEYLQQAAGQGGFAGVDQEIENYINTKPAAEPITVTDSAQLGIIYQNAYRLTHGQAASPAEEQAFVNYYQQQQQSYEQTEYNAKNTAESAYEKRGNTMVGALANTQNMNLTDFVKSYGQAMQGPAGAGLSAQRNLGGPQTYAQTPANQQYYVNPQVWAQYASKMGAGSAAESAVSPAMAKNIFTQIAATLYNALGSWQAVAEMMNTGVTKDQNNNPVTVATLQNMSNNANSIASQATGGIITPSGGVAAPVVSADRQTPEPTGEAAQYAESQNPAQVDATSIASLASGVLDRMFSPDPFANAESLNANTGAGMPGNTALLGNFANNAQPTVTPAPA
jgi:hypothetical protein